MLLVICTDFSFSFVGLQTRAICFVGLEILSKIGFSGEAVKQPKNNTLQLSIYFDQSFILSDVFDILGYTFLQPKLCYYDYQESNRNQW
jgi:hypothetical protein